MKQNKTPKHLEPSMPHHSNSDTQTEVYGTVSRPATSHSSGWIGKMVFKYTKHFSFHLWGNSPQVHSNRFTLMFYKDC